MSSTTSTITTTVPESIAFRVGDDVLSLSIPAATEELLRLQAHVNWPPKKLNADPSITLDSPSQRSSGPLGLINTKGPGLIVTVISNGSPTQPSAVVGVTV